MNYKTKLSELDFSFLEFTHTPGALRCHMGGTKEKPKPKQGIFFQCPRCKATGKPSHGHTYLLEAPGVPSEASPPGRWTITDASVARFGVLEKVYSRTGCGFEGFIKEGEVSWK